MRPMREIPDHRGSLLGTRKLFLDELVAIILKHLGAHGIHGIRRKDTKETSRVLRSSPATWARSHSW